jgi:hypothetical protein
MNYAIIENGKVVNIVVAEPEFAQAQGWIELPHDVGIDFDYIDGQFIDNRPQIIEPEPTPTPTKEQLQAQLLELQQQIQLLV